MSVPTARGSRLGRHHLVVLGIVAVAAAARLLRLDLMEFKGDEAGVYRLALHALGYGEPGVGRFFPTKGITSSVGIPNPPLFVYVVSLPVAVIRSPLAATAVIAAANVVAVWLCYLAGVRIWSRTAGLVGSTLFAVSPWSIVFSRKIWAQDLLPIVGTLFLLEVHALIVGRKQRALMTLPILAAVGVQLHFSAVVLVIVGAAALIAARDTVDFRLLAVGLGIACLLWLPFLVLHGNELVHPHPASVPPTVVHRFANSVHLTAAIIGTDQLSGLVGWQPTAARPIALVLALLAFCGLALSVRDAEGRLRSLRGLALAWFVAPACLLTLLHTTPYIHYFIVMLPLPFLGLGYLVDRARRRLRLPALAAAAVVLLLFVATDIKVAQRIARDDGAPGDYGVSFRAERAVAAGLRREAEGRPIVLRGDVAGGAYHVLLWNQQPGAPMKHGLPLSFTIVDTFRRPTPRRAPGAQRLHVGPVVVLAAKRR